MEPEIADGICASEYETRWRRWHRRFPEMRSFVSDSLIGFSDRTMSVHDEMPCECERTTFFFLFLFFFESVLILIDVCLRLSGGWDRRSGECHKRDFGDVTIRLTNCRIDDLWALSTPLDTYQPNWVTHSPGFTIYHLAKLDTTKCCIRSPYRVHYRRTFS